MIDIDKHIQKLERKPGIQIGHMKVMSKIVKDLSSGIYSSPGNCIKELINNSFDADATQVIIRAKPSLDIFSITDNGSGMSIEDFSEKFSVISKSFKRVDTEISPIFKRPLIGKIGIGFIAVSEICDKMVVITKKKKDKGRIKAEIDFKKFKNVDVHENDEFYKKSEYKLEYEEILGEEDKQFTKIILSELTSEFKEMLMDKDANILKKEAAIKKERLIFKELEDKKFEDILDFFRNKEIGTYQQLGEYWKLVLDIARTIPIQYVDDGPVNIEKKNKLIEELKNQLKSYNFAVDFDGINLKKPILFPNEDYFNEYEVNYIVHTFEKTLNVNNSNLKFKGYIYSQHGGINPKEDAGILVRVKNVKVGEIDSSFFDYPFVSNQIFRHWNFGEIYIEEGLEDAMNIDRNSFRLSHIHYRALKKFLHGYLNDTIFPYCKKGFWEAKKKRKEKEHEAQQNRKIRETVKANFLEIKDSIKVEISTDRKGKPIEILPKESKIIIRTKTDPFKSFSKKEKDILQEILVFFESAYQKAKNQKEGIDELKKYFYDILIRREK